MPPNWERALGLVAIATDPKFKRFNQEGDQISTLSQFGGSN